MSGNDADNPAKTRTLPAALRAAILAELDGAIACSAARADDADTRVHDVRKHLKRCRALMRLLPQGLQARLGHVQRVVSRVARRLGTVRDPMAQRETWNQFVAKLENGSKLEVVSERLDRKRREQMERGLVERRLARAACALPFARSALEPALVVKTHRARKDVRVALKGLARSYRKARRALALALAKPSNENLHALRRANKAYQYELHFLQPAWPEVVKAERTESAKLSEQLGEHHDLGCIADWLGEVQAADTQPFVAAREQLTRWQRDLELASLHAAARLYSERPRALEQRFAGYLELTPAF